MGKVLKFTPKKKVSKPKKDVKEAVGELFGGMSEADKEAIRKDLEKGD